MEKEVYTAKEFADMIRVTVQTLRNWDKSGKLKADRDLTNHLLYTKEHFNKVFPNWELVKKEADDNV